MKHVKHILDIILIAVLLYLCCQIHEIKTGLEQLAEQQYQYEQITQFGTLCNIEHFTNDLK